jgi:outer membrane biosynthesis protein TonB
MSYSSPQKPPLEFLSQEKLQKTLMTLRHPSSLALLASIGIHGLLWMGAPLFSPANPEQPDTHRTVEIVELNPIEQLRLPDFATPEVQAIQPSPQSSPNTVSSPPPAPPSPFDQFDPIVPPPPVTWIPPIFNITPLTIPRRPVTQQTPKPQTSPTPQPTPTTSTSPTASPSPEASPAPTRPAKIPQAAIDHLRNLQARGLNVYDAIGTTEGEATGKAGEWLARLQKPESTDAGLKITEDSLKTFKTPIILEVPYPPEVDPASLSKAGEAIVGVIVNQDGKVAEEPELIRSTGYQRLNRAALAIAKVYEPELKPTGNTQIYVFRISFVTKPEDAKPQDAKPENAKPQENSTHNSEP